MNTFSQRGTRPVKYFVDNTPWQRSTNEGKNLIILSNNGTYGNSGNTSNGEAWFTKLSLSFHLIFLFSFYFYFFYFILFYLFIYFFFFLGGGGGIWKQGALRERKPVSHLVWWVKQSCQARNSRANCFVCHIRHILKIHKIHSPSLMSLINTYPENSKSCIQHLKFQIRLRLISDLSWKFNENAFVHVSIMSLTDMTQHDSILNHFTR